jgi:hypothetical protein
MTRKLQTALLKTCFALVILLSYDSWSQTTLHFTYDGGAPDANIIGLTGTGLGPNYPESPRINFDSAGDALVLYFSGAPGVLAYTIKWHPTSGSSFPGTFQVQESADGINYTLVRNYGNGVGQINLGIAPKITNGVILNPATRYVRWIYTVKSEGNISLGTLNLPAPVPSSSAPSLINIPKSAVTTTGATFGGNVTSIGNQTVTATGNVYSVTSMNGNPIIGGTGVTQIATVIPNAGVGSFTTSTSALAPNTRYSYNAYATNSINTSYGAVANFYTLANQPGTPTVGNPTTSSLDVSINANGNPLAITQYAIMTGPNYVQANGTLGGAAVWQTIGQWLNTVTVSGLASNTAYNFSVKARNGSGIETAASTGATGTTSEVATPTATLTTLAAFGAQCTGTTSTGSFILDASDLDGSDLTVSGAAGYSFSAFENGTYAPTLSISYPGTSIEDMPVWVRFGPIAVAEYNGNITLSGGGLANGTITTPVSGSGSNTPATVSNGTASAITSTSATVSATAWAGCSAVIAYGVEYSTVNNFAIGSGTTLAGSDLASGNFSANAVGLSPNMMYYFRTFAQDATGTINGVQQSFMTAGISAPDQPTATDITPNSFTAHWNAVTGATGYTFDVSTSPIFETTVTASTTAEDVGNLISFLISGLEENTTYYFRVRAVSGNSTSANSPAASATTLTAPATFGSVAQAPATCDGTDIMFNLAGLLADSTSAISYNINNGAMQIITGIVADGSGNGSFILPLTSSVDGQTLTVTAIQRTDEVVNAVAVTTNNTVVLDVNAFATYYADADGDGYGNAVISTSVCTGATAGYVANNTDCDDANNQVNPGYTEVLYNGIDDNCDGQLDEGNQIVTQLYPQYCGITLSQIYQALSVNYMIPNLTYYRFRIRNQTNPAEPVQYLERTYSSFKFTDFARYDYGATYLVDAMVQRNGVWLGYYGNACSVTTPAVPQLQNCGGTVAAKGTLMFSQVKQNITGYRFEVTRLTTGQVSVVNTGAHYFSFNNVPFYAPGEIYTVRVAVKTTGDYSAFGNACIISTPGHQPGNPSRENVKATVEDFVAVAYPNPYASSFDLKFTSNNQAGVQVKVYDMLGRTIEIRNIDAASVESQQFGDNYPAGVYNVIVTQADAVRTLRVIKR